MAGVALRLAQARALERKGLEGAVCLPIGRPGGRAQVGEGSDLNWGLYEAPRSLPRARCLLFRVSPTALGTFSVLIPTPERSPS